MSAQSKRGSYPHPVLDDSDDVDSSFEVFNVTVAPTVEDVELRFQVRMTDSDIQALIDDGQARLSFRWKCGATLSSEELEPSQVLSHVDSTSYVAWIPQERIRRSVRVEVKVVAATGIAGYSLERQHEDYGGAKFDISSGDVLADGGSFSFEADKLYDPLNPPIGSCFKFLADPKLKRGVKVHFHLDDYVIVAFPQPVLDGLANTASRPDLQISLAVLPALMQTIFFMKENADRPDGEDLSDKLWFQAITKQIEANGSLEDTAFELAQKILNNPLDASLSTPLVAEEDIE